MDEHPVPSEYDIQNSLPRPDVHETNERDSLLQPSTSKSEYKPARWQPRSPLAIVTLLYSIIFLLQFGAKMMYVPSIRIFEWIICHHYFDGLKGDRHIGLNDDLPESMCKIQEVQSELNVLVSVVWMLNCIPALITTVFYGSLADRIGRRPIFALSLTGLILGGVWDIVVMSSWRILPVRLAWLSPITAFLGGGESVANMMFFAIANDVTSEANRSTVFLLGGVGALVAEIIGPSIAAVLMLRSVWLPIIIGMSCLVVGTSFIIFLPETLHLRGDKVQSDADSMLEDDFDPKYDNSTLLSAVTSRASHLWSRLYRATRMLHSLPIILLLMTFLVGPFQKVGSDMFLRYISNRLNWPLREVSFLLSLKAFFNLLLIVALLPGASYLLTNYFEFTVRSKDLLLAQVSIVLLTVGVIVMTLAATVEIGIVAMIVWTFGSGYIPFARSLITSLVDARHVGRLFAVIAIVELMCGMVAAPSLGALYSKGLQTGWHGLPYFVLGVLTGFGGICLFAFGWLKRKDFAQAPIRLEEEDHASTL